MAWSGGMEGKGGGMIKQQGKLQGKLEKYAGGVE